MPPRPPRSPLFPYTTLFRSHRAGRGAARREGHDPRSRPAGRIGGRGSDRQGGSRDYGLRLRHGTDRKSTRLNSSHVAISYAVFCLKKKKTKKLINTIAYNSP